MFKKILLWACMLVVVTVGCSKEETITEKQLMETLDGYGWKWFGSTPLKKVENKFVEGWTSDNYYFHDGIATVYFSPDFQPGHFFWDLNIRYDASRNELGLWCEDGVFVHSLHITDLTGKRFKAICSDRKDVLQTWQKMTEEELSSYQAKYTNEYSR